MGSKKIPSEKGKEKVIDFGSPPEDIPEDYWTDPSEYSSEYHYYDEEGGDQNQQLQSTFSDISRIGGVSGGGSEKSRRVQLTPFEAASIDLNEFLGKITDEPINLISKKDADNIKSKLLKMLELNSYYNIPMLVFSCYFFIKIKSLKEKSKTLKNIAKNDAIIDEFVNLIQKKLKAKEKLNKSALGSYLYLVSELYEKN
jgi:hypothetical protein